MREGSPKKLSLSQTISDFQAGAKSLFRNIFDPNPCGSIFCRYPSIPNRAKFIETNILAEGYQKKVRYRSRRQESFCPRPTFRRPSGAHFQSDATLPGAGSAGLFSSAPTGLVTIPAWDPQLAPLRQAQGRLWAAFFRRFAAFSPPFGG